MGLIKRKAKSVVRRKVKTPLKRKARQQARRVAVTCGTCGKSYTNPLTHTCTVKTDYKKRVAAEKRRQATEARRAKAAEQRQRARERKAATRARQREAAKARRKAAADRRKAAAAARRKPAARPRSSRPSQPKHDYHVCRDGECERYTCVAFKEGYGYGDYDGYQRGYHIGFPDGIAACPLSHGGK